MARIPESEIERLKNEVSVERLIESAGIELKKSGKNFLGKCPFHDDAEPSLVVTPAKNLWHCFGCQIGGGPIDWVMKANGVSFRHAVELLREGVSTLAASPVKHTTVRALAAPVAFDADDAALRLQVAGYYHETLKQSPEALAYLKARGLDHPELIDTFKLGFANRTLGLRLPHKNRVAGSQIRARLQKTGLLRESGHEHFNGSLIVPVFGEQGGISEVYGRKINDKLTPGTPRHLYLPEHCRTGARGVWNVAALQASREIILCEALIDAMTFWCAGYRNVTAAYGVEGFTDAHLAAFQRHGVTRVLIAYDRDDAGERAAEKHAALLMAVGIECFRIQFPKGMDANEYALKVTPANKSLGVVIRKAVWLIPDVEQSLRTAPRLANPSGMQAARWEGKGAAPDCENEFHQAPAPQQSPSVSSPALSIPGQALAASAAKEKTPLPASPVPPGPASDEAFVSESEIIMTFAQGAQQRRWRVRGLAKNLSFEVLKVNVYAALGERFHLDTLDLYSSKARAHYVMQAALELRLTEEIVKADLARVFRKLEELQQAAIQEALLPKVPEAVQMGQAEREAALELLTDPKLMQRILADFTACGIVGEDTNKLTGYLACVSRLLPRPLAVVLQSSSAAGKSALMDAVLAFMPQEERTKYSAMTGQSLFYMGETNLKHKILAIVEEEGASKAAYALKLLQSEGELTIASTGKDAATGNLITQEYRVEGPVMIFLTTTAIEIDEELLNRCLVLSVDEGRAQTEAIHRLQRARRTLQGLIDKQERLTLIALHQNAQRLLKPLHVVNPYADHLTFLSDRTRTRRDHEKYLTLIDAIALLHQHQREVKAATHQGQVIEYIEVTTGDIARANALAHEVLGRSLDELPPQTRRLLGEVVGLVDARAVAQALTRSEVRFTRRDVRDHAGWSDFQVKTHMHKLEALEYVLVHRGGRGQSFEYELLYDGDGSRAPHLFGLIDIDALKHGYDANKEHAKQQLEHPSSPQVAPKEHPSSSNKMPAEPISTGVSGHSSPQKSKPHNKSGNGKTSSYPPLPLAALAQGR